MDSGRRVILHVDMDAFFAQVEGKAAPGLRGRALIVGGRPGERGAVACASYEARAFGIRSGMSLAESRRLCPQAVFLPCTPSRYFDVSFRVLRILLGRTSRVEPTSIDEAAIDAAGLAGTLEEGTNLALSIRNEIADKLSLTCSIGIGPNKLIARMASGWRKPNGISACDGPMFCKRFWPEPVERLHAVGTSRGAALREDGIATIEDLARAPVSLLEKRHGEAAARHLHDAAWGRDESPVVPIHAKPRAKSLGHAYTLPAPENDRAKIRTILVALSERVARDLRDEGLRGRSVRIRIVWAGGSVSVRQTTVPAPMASDEGVIRSAWAMFDQCDHGEKVRSIGITMGGIVAEREAPLTLDLFVQHERNRWEEAADSLRRRFGESVIRRASLLPSRARRRSAG